MAERLEKVLGKISGVGRVEVLLTLERGPEYLYARTADKSSRETREEDSTGGTREIRESTDRSQLVLTRAPQGLEEPVPSRRFSRPSRGWWW
jgi:stage III sporulation protein AG